MPKITITEVDKSRGILEYVSTNAAYVPGYAITGPINEAIYCSTLEEFENIFGKEPYRFKSSYTYTGGSNIFISEDDYEKSYIYAHSLLESGLPVVYKRMFTGTSDNIEKWTATANLGFNQSIKKSETVVAKQIKVDYIYPGKYGSNYSIKVVNEGVKFIFTVLKGTSEVEKFETSVFADADNNIKWNTYESKFVKLTLPALENGELKDVTFTITSSTAESLAIPSDSSGDEFTPTEFYTLMGNSSSWVDISDVGSFDVKFITSGGYPLINDTGAYDSDAFKELGKCVTLRKDCIGLYDGLESAKVVDTDSGNSLYTAVQTLGTDSGIDLSSCAIFAPHVIFKSDWGNITLPASFAYLNTMAESIKTNVSWLAVAGVTRGIVKNIVGTTQLISNLVADNCQPRVGVSVNCITNIKEYGYTIWGNRTLKNNTVIGGVDGLTATSFLNIRNMVCDIKKIIRLSSIKLTFEPNDTITWINFKSFTTPLLDQLVSGRGLSGYKWKRESTNKKATIKATLVLYAIEPVEDFEITIELSDSSTNIVE